MRRLEQREACATMHRNYVDETANRPELRVSKIKNNDVDSPVPYFATKQI